MQASETNILLWEIQLIKGSLSHRPRTEFNHFYTQSQKSIISIQFYPHTYTKGPLNYRTTLNLSIIAMGFLGPIPANELAAVYDPTKHKLTLSAQGEIQDYTTNISFNRLPWAGGLKFQLEGWTGPLHDSHSPYSYQQDFDILLPNPVTPSGNVIIADANHPDGVVVPIHFLGLAPPAGNKGAPKQVPGTENTAQPQLLSSDDEQINALFKTAFQIKESTDVPKFGQVSLKFDSNYLNLQQAGIQDKNIVWTFNSLQTGNTQVVVTVAGGIAPYVLTKSYDIRIFVLDQPLADTSINEQAILSFLGFVNIAVRLVREKYPEAQLYEVEAAAPNRKAVTNPIGLSQLKIVFRVAKGTAIIKSTGWGEFAPIEFIPAPWLEDVVIPWPIDMDAAEANTLLRKAGYTGDYAFMTLRHPLYPGANQPYYIFTIENGPYVFVGVNDKTVTVNNAGQALLPTNKGAAQNGNGTSAYLAQTGNATAV